MAILFYIGLNPRFDEFDAPPPIFPTSLANQTV